MRLQGTRAGTQPRPAQRAVQPVTLLLGPNLPRAACKGLADLWDDRVDNEPEEHRTQRHDQAIGTCRECPVRADCLTARLTEPDLGNGVWGGQLFTTTRKCPCGNALPPDAKYCSEDCRTGTRDRTKPAERTVTCVGCPTIFTTIVDIQKYCTRKCRRRSLECKRSSRIRSEKRVATGHGNHREQFPGLTHCQGCGTPFTERETQFGKRSCSRKCKKRTYKRDQHAKAA